MKKTALVSGGFTVYGIAESNGKKKLVKYKATVTGFVVGGRGYAQAVIKNIPPADAEIL